MSDCGMHNIVDLFNLAVQYHQGGDLGGRSLCTVKSSSRTQIMSACSTILPPFF